MALGKDDKEKILQLREKRIKLSEQRESVKKRNEYGHDVVAKINQSLGLGKSLSEYDPAVKLPVDFIRKPDFKECPGLVAAYISEGKAFDILSCCGQVSGKLKGTLGFDDHAFVGATNVEFLQLQNLVETAKLLNDSVLFCPQSSDSIILVDYYVTSGVIEDLQFSIVVQGQDLEHKFACCF